MPELPEVEIICRALNQRVRGKKLESLTLINSKLRYPIPNTLKSIKGQTLIEIHRRGRYLLFEFEKGWLLSHLGMTGKFLFRTEKSTHDHLQLNFKDSPPLFYNDVRKFGFFKFSKEKPHLSEGVEPLTEDFSPEHLFNFSQKHRLTIKGLLLSGKAVCGVGNIYCAESLFLAKISPLKIHLTLAEANNLCLAIKTILKAAIKAGGSTLKDFESPSQEKGYFPMSFKVYGKENKPCPKCKNPIKRVLQNGRSSFYCEKCQKI